MDKTAIRKYAVAARRKLIEAVRQKAYSLYIYENGAEPSDVAVIKLRADGVFLTDKQLESRQKLCAYLAQLNQDMDNEKAYNHAVEEVAYTWFNRLIALRFMEVNDYLPSGIRILSSVEAGRAESDAMREAERLAYVDQDKISEFRADTNPGASEKLCKYILISQCNALHDILPRMFQKIDDYTELLLPDALFQQGGIVHDLISSIREKDFRIRTPEDETNIKTGTIKEEDAPAGQIQIIGWLYQYYISEKKDEVFAGLRKNIKINKETLPAATQLFTPEWIVKYMVENSLGRLWLERDRAESGLSSEHMNASYYGWKYYVEEAEQEPDVAEQLKTLAAQNPVKSPEDIKIIDPCMGSGHILVYAFDLLYQIYVSQGYAEREIPNLILQNNIYGLDIDGRAAQLAYFALMMKARSYSRRFFRQDNIPQPHVHAVIESDGAEKYHLDYMGYGMSEADQNECKYVISYLIDLFRDAREYGSVLKIEKKLDYNKLRGFVKAMRSGQMDIFFGDIEGVAGILLETLDIAESLTRQYDVVVTNPPYMGSSGMGSKLSDYVKENYPDSKADMFAVFIERCGEMLSEHGYQAMITQHSWMFLSTYSRLRKKVMQRDIVNMAHLGARAFDEISGEVVQTTTFVIKNFDTSNLLATYIRLVDYDGQSAKEQVFLSGECRYTACKEDYMKIPGTPITYWVSQKVIDCFQHDKFAKYTLSDGQNKTGNNERFLRYLWEVSAEKIGRDKRWVLCARGGEVRKWYGNIDEVIDWSESARTHYRKDHVARIVPEHIWFRKGITWSRISSKKQSFRIMSDDELFEMTGLALFINDEQNFEYLLGLSNSIVFEMLLRVLTPVLTIQIKDVRSIPVISANERLHQVSVLVANNIAISQADWDSYETSWNFKTHPLVSYKIIVSFEGQAYLGTIKQAFDWWATNAEQQFNKLKSNEEELNRIFIDIYSLQGELTPEVQDKDVTIRKADLGRDIRGFLSYAVGCIFGRYSLDEPGLVFAGGEFDLSRYKTFLPEKDNVLPIGSADYFDDDIMVRFIEFVRIVYGDATLAENLNFIADALYPNINGSAKDKIRRYFLNDFYKDHLKVYQKRPIYWLMDSGKKDGFKALFYLHHYDKYTVARARTDYLHPLQRKYEAEISRLEMLSVSTDNARERAAYRKEIEVLHARIDECRLYDQVVAHIAHQQIELDLDDGVKVNYAKFQYMEVPKDNGKTEKMDLLAKI